MTNLIPASNFQIKNLKGLKVNFSSGSVALSGWGVFDLTAKGFVSMGDVVPTVEGMIPIPYALKTRRVATEAISKGLYQNYTIVKIA